MIIDRNFETSIICTFGEVFSMNSNDLENNPAVISDKLVRGALFKLGHIYAQANIFDHVIRRCNQAKRKLSAV